jgi:hypothetical protein
MQRARGTCDKCDTLVLQERLSTHWLMSRGNSANMSGARVRSRTCASSVIHDAKRGG